MHNLLTVTIFMGLGAVMVFFTMVMGALARPKLPGTDKEMSYECGEPPIGNSWVQFDLRFYIVALVFLVFDVEIALFYPWAAVFQEFKREALIDMLIFFAVLMVGYVYLWRFGYLEWVRSSVTTSLRTTKSAKAQATAQLSATARKDPELAEL
jgi:NADH-quinone oxidoreductase subunit A